MAKKKKSSMPQNNNNNNSVKERLQKKVSFKSDKPRVSVCTPTFNRRPFIQMMFKCFLHQDYPKELIEWIIIDDGSDPIEDLIKTSGIEQIKYFKYSQKMSLGKKRNLLHEKSSGDIIVYMDDDDYYPPQRISHAVDMLLKNPKAMCAGSSEIYIWFKHIQKMYQFGPYGPQHATAGTFAFRRELLNDHRYDDEAALAEEKAFLKNYTVPFVQLEPKKVILVFSHNQNTFDKKKLLDNPNKAYCKESDRTVDEFIKEPELKEWYMNKIDEVLENYEPGDPRNKPDVLKQIIEIEEKRRKHAESMVQPPIMIQQPGSEPKAIPNQQIVAMLTDFRQKNQELANILKSRDEEIANLKNNIGSDNIKNDDINNPPIIAEGPNGEKKVLNSKEIIQILQQKDREIQQLQLNKNNNNQQNMTNEEREFLKSIGALDDIEEHNSNNDNKKMNIRIIELETKIQELSKILFDRDREILSLKDNNTVYEIMAENNETLKDELREYKKKVELLENTPTTIDNKKIISLQNEVKEKNDIIKSQVKIINEMQKQITNTILKDVEEKIELIIEDKT